MRAPACVAARQAGAPGGFDEAFKDDLEHAT
jgi:hypothetical protein